MCSVWAVPSVLTFGENSKSIMFSVSVNINPDAHIWGTEYDPGSPSSDLVSGVSDCNNGITLLAP